MNPTRIVVHTIAWLLAGVLVALVCIPGPAVASAQDAETRIYYYRDSRGVFHFTNKPKTTRYRLFAIFRHHPEIGDDEVRSLARKYATKYGLDHRLIYAVIQVESNFDKEAVSHAGAEGLMQIMPETQKDLGVRNSFDPEENIEAGVRYLREQINRFGSLELALAAYNAGPAQVERYKGIPPFDETRRYVGKVLALYKKMR